MTAQATGAKPRGLNRVLNGIEVAGNKLPDPAILFALLLAVVWVTSWAMSGLAFNDIDPRTGQAIEIRNLLTQAAYRVGDSSTNIITPLLPYFPLIIVFCKKYVQSTGIGTLITLMLPYSISLIVTWTAFLLAFWARELPLGIGSSYDYPAER